MLMRAWETFTEFNQTGMVALITYPASIWSGFIPLILFSFFMIALLGSHFASKRLRGRSNFWGSFTVAGYLTTVVSIVMSLIPGLVDLFTLSVVLTVTVIGTIFLFVTKTR